MQLTEAVHECDRLKREMAHYGQHLESLHRQGLQNQRGNLEQMEREWVSTRNENEVLKDENIAMKLRIAEIEGQLMEERQAKEVKLDLTIKDYKANMQGQYLDYKLKLDELIMVEKERNNKLRLEAQRY
jgi:hypothetical protein